MTLQDLHDLYEDTGHSTAWYAIKESDWPYDKKEELFEELERLHAESLRRWTHPSRYSAAYDPHEF